MVTTLNPVYTSHEIAHQMSDSGAVAIVTVPALLAKVEGAVAQGAPVRRVYLVGDSDCAAECGEPQQYEAMLSAYHLRTVISVSE